MGLQIAKHSFKMHLKTTLSFYIKDSDLAIDYQVS